VGTDRDRERCRGNGGPWEEQVQPKGCAGGLPPPPEVRVQRGSASGVPLRVRGGLRAAPAAAPWCAPAAAPGCACAGARHQPPPPPPRSPAFTSGEGLPGPAVLFLLSPPGAAAQASSA